MFDISKMTPAQRTAFYTGFVMLAVIYAALAWGLTLFFFWYWYILPVFPTLPHISFPAAIGLYFMTAFFKSSQTNMGIKDEFREQQRETIYVFVMPLFVLFCGWILHFFL